MFDFSFGEMLVVGLVALIVLGPERLPKAARFVGLWVRRARAQWYSVKSELEHELASDELRQSLADGKQIMRETEAELRATDAKIRNEVADTAAEVRAATAADAGTIASPGTEIPNVESPTVEGLAAESPAAESPADKPMDATADMPRQDAHEQ